MGEIKLMHISIIIRHFAGRLKFLNLLSRVSDWYQDIPYVEFLGLSNSSYFSIFKRACIIFYPARPEWITKFNKYTKYCQFQ
jgi:hypothetical protein